MSEERILAGVAVVGMAVRTPGAADLEAFWKMLLDGRDCISHFEASEIDPLVPEALRGHPHFVAARGVLEEAECFDAGLFGLSANQARLLDPQQRVFLELCWHALEHAGLDPERSDASVGVYAGTANNTWLQTLRQAVPELIERNGEFASMVANEKDYVATRIAHFFNFDGPAIGVYTACSSSLVAIAQAWYALMNYQCDAALAGASAVIEPQIGGYISVEGGMESPHGACRPFDADADGTVFSSGGGCVVLKRVEDALADGDTIHAVIGGVGVNNDGADKASFTAPNPAGQAAAIRLALAQAGIEAASIGYVETHGTGTALGDPIEIAALRDAFALADQSAHCLLGSVKSNIGHLTAAAGVVGLIKTVLCLEREIIPPTVHFRKPNPRIDFDATPFRVASEVNTWPRGEAPRRAGVSSFGVGGTNAHVVLEESPAQAASPSERSWHILPLSANGEEELRALARRMNAALTTADAASLADAAWSLSRGRRHLPRRCAIVARDGDEAASRLARPLRIGEAEPMPRVIWLFPGQGSQYPGMAASLWRDEPDFRAALEPLLTLADEIDAELRELLLEAEPGDEHAAGRLAQTERSQPALFLVSYAMARALQAHGLEPDAMIGHSIGEYVAACLAGVFSPEDALKLVARRGALMQAQPPGDMVAVHAGADALRPLLVQGVDIACYNAEALQVISGAHEAVQAQLAELEKEALRHSRLKVSHAFHSPLMAGALPEFTQAVESANPQLPGSTFYACPEGRPITVGEACDPAYWASQIRSPVRFADSLRHALDDDRAALLMEVGPGHALSTLARAARGSAGQKPRAIVTFGASVDGQDGEGSEVFARALGEVWAHGAHADLGHRYVEEKRRHVPLPGYPFRHDYYGYARSDTSAFPSNSVAASEAPPAVSDGAEASARIVELLAEVSGEPVESIDPERNFVAQGLDSLLLTQFSLALEKELNLKVRFRRLMEDLDTPDKLAAHARAQLPSKSWSPPQPAEPSQATTAAEANAARIARGDSSDIKALLASQQQLLEQQATLLDKLIGGKQDTASAATKTLSVSKEKAKPDASHSEAFGASARISLQQGAELEPEQKRWLEAFVARYTQRTAGSRNFTQRHRRVMADPRAVTGFDPRWKDMVYPIVVDRSSGARLWDIDGNEYIDLLNGFGSNFLGYQPPFVAEALHAQIDTGYEIGPQHPLAAEVCELIAEFTDLPRVALCNTGSEAVMGAMRIARTVTGRETVAIFRDSYHGIFDEAVVRGTSRFEARPAAPGIAASAVSHMLVLDYGSEEALEILRRRASELAAIVIEPIQARHPELTPKAFVKTLREIADEAGCALVFDEVITGFRVALGGAQAYYSVRADIGTYGKIVGGGLPFAAIAGQSRWMDALDGGDWRYGDDSRPEAGVTYFAGTFVRHPLALAAARAALQYLREAGPALQQSLNERTTQLVARLNRHLRASHAPLEAVATSSMWRLRIDDDQPFAGLLFYLLRHHGLHVYEQFGCFLSTAHGEAEIDAILARINQAVDELLEAGRLQARRSATFAAAQTALAQDTGKLARAPMTAGQLEIWVNCQHGREALLSYNEGALLHLEGDLDRLALRLALEDLWARHEGLRIAIDGAGESQSVNDCALPFADVDLREGEDGAAAGRLEVWTRSLMQTPFDVGSAPLVRIHLLRLADKTYVLHVIGHHLVLDGWSLAVFVRELAVCYNARRSGREPELPTAASFLDYARNEQARREKSTAALDYWQAELAGAPEAVSFGHDDEVSTHPASEAATFQHDFAPGSLRAVRERAGAVSVTPFSALLSAFAILLWRLSDQRDLVVCIPFAGQAMVGAEHMIGDGVNTLPVRIRIDPNETLSQLLKRVHGKLLDAADHQDTTLLNIASRLTEKRLRGREPLSRIIFNKDPHVPPPHFDGLEAHLRDCDHVYGAWDLGFDFLDTGEGLAVAIDYARAKFDPNKLEQWMASYAELLDILGSDADPFVGQLANRGRDSQPASEAAMLVADAAPDAPPDVLELIERQVGLHPHKTAITAGSTSLSYMALWQQSALLARRLVASGVGEGEPVGICVPRDEQMPLALLAVLRSGAAYVPLDPDLPDARLRYMLECARVNHVLIGSHGPVPAAILEGGVHQHDMGKIADATEPELPRANPDALAYVLYTSGSTGRPKGVRVLRRNLASFLAAARSEPGMGERDRLCAVTTLSFDIAAFEMFLPLVSGADIVIADHDAVHDPEKLLALIAQRGATWLQNTPSLLRMLLAADTTGVLRGLRLMVGGEPLPLDLARAVLANDCELWNGYGPTETTIYSSLWQVPPEVTRITIGRPLEGVSIYMLDADHNPVAAGAEGEIWIGGTGVADGYQGEAGLTAEHFLPDPFAGEGRMYRTGDLGHIENGLLYFHGRADNQIKLRGHRIELGEIEAVARAVSGVGQAAVAVHALAPDDARLVLYAVGDRAEAGDVLKQTLIARLPAYMQAQHIVWLDALPMTPNGKLDRRALPAPPDADGTGRHVSPRSKSEVLAVAAFNEVFGRSDVGVFDDFFDLGGHSLMALRLIAKLRADARVDLPLRNLFEQPTPEQLAAAIDALVWVAGADRNAVDSGEHRRGDREEIEL